MRLHTEYRRFACPICGEMPRIVATHNPNELETVQYKAFCTGNSVHISDGVWWKTKLDAWRDWKKRRVDRNQPDFWYVSNGSKLFGGHYTAKKAADFLRRVQTGEFQLPDGMTWEQWLDYPHDGKFPVGYPFD